MDIISSLVALRGFCVSLIIKALFNVLPPCNTMEHVLHEISSLASETYNLSVSTSRKLATARFA